MDDTPSDTIGKVAYMAWALRTGYQTPWSNLPANAQAGWENIAGEIVSYAEVLERYENRRDKHA